jgi:integrase
MPKVNGQAVDYLSPEQRELLEALVARRVADQAEAQNPDIGTWRDAAMVNLLLESGIRRAECCALDWSDITWDEQAERGYVRVRYGKGGKSRTSYFTEATWRYLAAWRDIVWDRGEPDPNRPVFITLARRKVVRLHPRGLDHIMKGISEEFGIKVRAHKLRHTSAKYWGPRVGPYALMSMFGWGSRKMADHYCRLDERDVADIIFGRQREP